MNNKTRHLVAFIVTTMVYGVVITSILGFDGKNQVPNQVEVSETRSIKIALLRENNTIECIQPTKPTKKEPISQEKPIQPKEKIIKKEPKIIEKIAEKIEPTPLKKELQPEMKPEPKIEKTVEKTIEKPIARIVKNTENEEKIVPVKQTTQSTITQKTIPIITETEINSQTIQNKKKQYFQLIKEEIKKHKYYPPNALKRGIECDIKVKFIVSPAGQLVSLESIEGNKIFHNSVKEAIEKSFPLLPPENILSENEVLSLVISYTIN